MLVYVLFWCFAPFCLDSVVSGESVFAGEEFEEFQGQQGKSHRFPNNPLSMLILFKAIVFIQLLHLFLNVIGWNQPILCYSLFCSCLSYSLIPWVIII